VAAGALLATPGCSFIFDLGADQCELDSDCDKFGADFPICDAGVCVAKDVGGTAGSGGNAGSSNQMPDAGAGGEPPVAECATNVECIDKYAAAEYICQAGQCVSLTTDECPLVVGAENLRSDAVIVFGAYALAPDSGASRSTAVRNMDLAISEFTSKVTGLRPLATDGKRRTLAIVVCNSSYPDIAPGTIDPFLPSLDHLVGKLKVPGIISALSAKNLEAVFSQRLDQAGTFVISPYEQDSELAALSDGGRLWTLLGATSDLAPAFMPLLKRTEAYLRRDELFLNLPEPGAPLRVALVAADIARETDIADALLEIPELNQDFVVSSYLVESALLTESPDLSELTTALMVPDTAPHIIVALAGSEFVEQVFPVLEVGTAWGTKTRGQQRPIYILGAAMAPQTWLFASEKRNTTGTNGYTTLLNRMVGVAYASSEDTRLRDTYLSRLIRENQDLDDPGLLAGSENVYDAAYLMVYAAAAAGQVPELTGKEMALGMRRLLSGPAFDIGPGAISDVLNALDNEDEISLNLTLGEAGWNAARGTRNGLGSVYCFNDGGTGLEADSKLPQGPVTDVLRFDPVSQTLDDDPLLCIKDF
jgi:hypothetical protein